MSNLNQVVVEDNYDFADALKRMKQEGSREAEFMNRQPLQYLKAGEPHRIRILPGVTKPTQFFAWVTRHYIGNPVLAPFRQANARKASICTCSIYPEDKCFCCDVKRYFEAVGSPTASEFLPREAAIVHAYKPKDDVPQAAPYLIVQTNMSQLLNLWKDGYIFFHPQKGFPVVFTPIPNMNLFTVTADSNKPSAISEGIMPDKDLRAVVESLAIPYETMKTWFIGPLVKAVDHFVSTGEALPIQFGNAPAAPAQPAKPAGTSPPAPATLADTDEYQMPANFTMPAAGASEAPPWTTPPTPGANAQAPDFLEQLKTQMASLGK